MSLCLPRDWLRPTNEMFVVVGTYIANASCCFVVWLKQVLSLLSIRQSKSHPNLAELTIFRFSETGPPSRSQDMTSKARSKSLSNLHSPSNLFPLGQAPLVYLPDESRLANKRLKEVKPLFSLPKLQEHSSTQDRLLLGLSPEVQQRRSQDHSQVSVSSPFGILEDEPLIVRNESEVHLKYNGDAVDQETLWEKVSPEHTMKLAGSSVSYIYSCRKVQMTLIL